MPGLFIATLLIGAALGMRFKVFVLVPTFGLSLVAVLAAATAHGSNALACCIAAVLAFAGLQVGYLSGALLRFHLRANASSRLTNTFKVAWPRAEAMPFPPET